MKVRMIIVGIAATLALAGSSIALGDGAQRRLPGPPAANDSQRLPKSLVKVQRTLGKGVRVRCGTIQCVNGALTAIGKAFRHMTGCMSYIEIGRYDGYIYSNDGGATEFETTALDEVEPGEPSTHAAVFVC